MRLTKEQKIDFMKKAAFIADESSCGYKVGCVGVIEDNGQKINEEALKDPYIRRRMGVIYVKSWNQTLPGEIYCQERDENGKRICIRVKENLKGKEFQKVCSSHAEIGLIAKCAKYGIPTKGMHVFLTNSPCIICARALVQTGVGNVYYMAKHTDAIGLVFLKRNKISIKKLLYVRTVDPSLVL